VEKNLRGLILIKGESNMGYRSTVAYTIRFTQPSHDKPEEVVDIEDVKSSFYLFIAEAKAKVETAGAFTDEDIKIDEGNLAIYFYAGHVKWYESYPDVACHEALMQLSKDWCDGNEGENTCPFIGGMFARIGEEMEDMVEEVWGQGEYGWIGIHRTMECDWMN
jgi:hypothetical protein